MIYCSGWPDRFDKSHTVAEGFVAVFESLSDPGLVKNCLTRVMSDNMSIRQHLLKQ